MMATRYLRATAPGFTLQARCTLFLRGTAHNASLSTSNPGSALDITLAKASGYILADASELVGFNPQNPGQRDPNATLALDPSGRIANP